MQQTIKHFIEGSLFQRSIIGLIILNAIILGLETSSALMEQYGQWFHFLDTRILYIFVIEIALRIYVYGWHFFTRPWSLFDLAIVAIAFIPASEAFAALRTLRVLRVLRLLSAIPTMRRVIEGLLSAIPGIASVATIMLLFFYVFAVIGTHLYSPTFPEWFGSIGKTMYTLFQIMTLESWSMGIVRPIMEQHPSAWLFFITYILVTTFTTLNLFIAIIVNALHQGADEEAEESRLELKEALSIELNEMEKRLMTEIKNIKEQNHHG